MHHLFHMYGVFFRCQRELDFIPFSPFGALCVLLILYESLLLPAVRSFIFLFLFLLLLLLQITIICQKQHINTYADKCSSRQHSTTNPLCVFFSSLLLRTTAQCEPIPIQFVNEWMSQTVEIKTIFGTQSAILSLFLWKRTEKYCRAVFLLNPVACPMF